MAYPKADLFGRLDLADARYSVRRVRRHFADAQERILTGRFGANSSESRLSEVGQFLPPATGSFLEAYSVDLEGQRCPIAR